MTVVLLQILLPLALLAWLIVLPADTRSALAAQACGVGAVLLALALVALWTFPPWWTPGVYAVIWAAATVVHGLRRRPASAGRSTARTATALALGAVLATLGGAISALALTARATPPVAVVDIPNPLGAGNYLVAHGGSRPLLNAHLKTLDPTVPRFAAWRGQSHAVDLIALDGAGLHMDGWWPTDPARYASFGRPVHAPCSGTIIGTANDLPDNRVPDMDRAHMLGNHVLLQCGPVVIVLAHFRRGTVRVAVDQAVAAGALLGAVGNSGNSSEPHLHVHAQRPGTAAQPIGGEPLALRINGRYPVRNTRLNGGGW